MKDGGRKIWIGCGIGCGLLALLAVGSCVGGWAWLRGINEPLQTAVEAREELERRQGAPGDYRPPADGRIPAERWEAFLAVREATEPARRDVARILEGLELSREEMEALEQEGGLSGLATAWTMTRDALALAPRLGAFLEARNATLLEREMGMGEYTWLYLLAFRSGPAPEPATGPGTEEAQPAPGTPDLDSMFGAPASDRIRRLRLAILEHLLDAAEEPAWRASLTGEIEAFRDDPERRLWPGGLPPRIEEGLAPRRARIEATAAPAVEGLEPILQRKTGAMSYRME